ncbi:MAG: ABC transporter ATP-binding protein [Thermodesulfobacteriota bacterium]|nr:ABC transporter ATP-binding protein [Thermodesulfobacteriota bacterium]
MPLLEVNNLSIDYKTSSGVFSAVKNLSFSLEKGKSIGIIGESGSGKTTVGMGIMRLLADNAIVQNGKIIFKAEDILTMSEEKIVALRGGKISMIFQAAMNSLNPVHRVGDQISEVLQVHDNKLSKNQADEKVKELFKDVGLSLSRISDFPHQYSGGMKQRAVIAMAIACKPDIIIADEPTTALDMIVQSQILKKLKEIQKKNNIAIVLISHDIGVVSEICHDIAVLYKGEMIEYGKKDDILASPLHQFTKKLISSCITLESIKNLSEFRGRDCAGNTYCCDSHNKKNLIDQKDLILEFKDVSKCYNSGRSWFNRRADRVAALNNVSFNIKRGEIFGLVGASGSGKTTIGRILVKLEKPDTGTITFNNMDVKNLKGRSLKEFRKKVQMVSQDPYQSLNPYFSVYDIVAEPLIIHTEKIKKECLVLISSLLEDLGLFPAEEYLYRYPHQLSGGQRQKVAIARGMVLNPEFMLADEPTSMLDSSVSMQIFTLLVHLKKKLGVTFLFITHNIAAAHLLCDRVAVIHHGEIVEMGDCKKIIKDPQAEHTKELIDSHPEFLLKTRY